MPTAKNTKICDGILDKRDATNRFILGMSDWSIEFAFLDVNAVYPLFQATKEEENWPEMNKTIEIRIFKITQEKTQTKYQREFKYFFAIRILFNSEW